jgi:prephenate dehydratase
MTNNSPNLVAFQGVPGAHSDLACRKAYPYMDSLPCASFEEVFAAVEEGRALYGMIPIENSQAGRVAEIHNLLPTTQLHFVGEHLQRIEHHLLGVKGASLAEVKHVYSHPQALMQCRESLAKLGAFERRSHFDTAGAVRDVAEWKDASKAAIGSALAGDLYGLQVLARNIEDSPDNTTLFITLSREPVDPDPSEGKVLTSLIFALRHLPSALYKALGGFATNNINLIKLESYLPTHAKDTAQFFVTFEGHPSQKHVQQAIEELGFFCKKVGVLGVYLADGARG